LLHVVGSDRAAFENCLNVPADCHGLRLRLNFAGAKLAGFSCARPKPITRNRSYPFGKTSQADKEA
jgi:hypothetical protein